MQITPSCWNLVSSCYTIMLCHRKFEWHHHIGAPSCWNHFGTIALEPSWCHWVGAQHHRTKTPTIPSFFYVIFISFYLPLHLFPCKWMHVNRKSNTPTTVNKIKFCCIGVVRWGSSCKLLLWAFMKVVVESYFWKTCYNHLLDLNSKLFSIAN
jgi:hypothetical protein